MLSTTKKKINGTTLRLDQSLSRPDIRGIAAKPAKTGPGVFRNSADLTAHANMSATLFCCALTMSASCPHNHRGQDINKNRVAERVVGRAKAFLLSCRGFLLPRRRPHSLALCIAATEPCGH